MEFRDYIAVLRRNLIVVLLLAIVGIGLGAGLTTMQKPTYQATARVLIAVRSSSNITDIAAGANLASTIVNTYAQVATSPYVLDGVIRDQGLSGITAGQLADQVTTATSTTDTVLDVTVRDGSPDRAAAVANDIMKRLAASSDTITPTAGGSAPVRLTVIQAASAPDRPASPILLLNLLVGGLAGIALASAVVILREAIDTRIKTLSGLRSLTDVPVLGRIHRDPSTAARPSTDLQRRDVAWSEAFQSLRTNLDFVDFGDASRSIVVTSSVPGEGKSTVATNLALAIADAGESVVLVDADLRRPTLAAAFGVVGEIGLSDVLAGRVDLDTALQTIGEQRLMLLPSGAAAPNPSELLRGQRMIELVETLGSRFSFVVFDSAPLGPVSDAALLARRTAGALVVTSVGRVRRPQLSAALEKLSQVDATVFGLVANRLESPPKNPYTRTKAPVPTRIPPKQGPVPRPKLGDAGQS